MDDTDEYAELRDEVNEVGEERAEATRELYRRLDEALGEYREDATGYGDFESYVEVQDVVVAAEEALEERDVYDAEGFKSALSRLGARTLQDKNFRRARDDLSDVRDFVERYDRYGELREELEDELSRLERRLRELDGEIDEAERALEKAESAEGVKVSPLRDAVEGYNESVRDDLDRFLREAPAVEVARLGELTLDAPLVEDAPVERGAAEALARHVGDETVDRIISLADSSDGKLSHHVDDPDGFREAVPRTLFETLDAEPFVLSYEPAGVARRRASELVSVIDSFADEETVAALRRVRDMAANGEYERMRRALAAREEAGTDVDALRGRLGSLRDEREDVEGRVEELRAVLDE